MVKIDFVNTQEPAINDTNLNQMQLNIENAINAQVSGDTLPVGCIVPFTSDTVPENWLLCDGSAVSRTTYDLLFSIIGTTYGVGDGSTTFNLPNLKGRVAVGKDSTQTEFDTLGETGGEKTHTLTVDEIPAHKHEGIEWLGNNQYNISLNNGSLSTGYTMNWSGTSDTNKLITGSTGGGQSHNILQPYQVTNYIIKANSSAGVVATVVDNLNSTSTTDALSANQGKILNSKLMYSTTETVVGTWIDGKPIYRKVLRASLEGIASSNLSFAHYISNLKIVICAEAYVTNDSDTTYVANNSLYPFEIIRIDSTNILTNFSDAYNQGWFVYFVLQYTKTND